MKCSNYLDYTTSPGDLAWPKVPLSPHSCVPPRNQGLGLGNYLKLHKNRGEDAQSSSVSYSCHELRWNPGQLLLAGSSVHTPGCAQPGSAPPAQPLLQPLALPRWAHSHCSLEATATEPRGLSCPKATFFTPPFPASDACRVPRAAAQPLDLGDKTNTKLWQASIQERSRIFECSLAKIKFLSYSCFLLLANETDNYILLEDFFVITI